MAAVLQAPSIDLREASRFLDLMAEGEPVTFQTFDDDAERDLKSLAHIAHGDLANCAHRLSRLNAAGAGVFWMVNYGDGTGRSALSVTGVRALFLDLDGAPLGKVLDAGVDPHAVIESSPGKWHVYWQVSGCPLEQFKPAQMALAARFNGDPTVKDLPRVLRVPGFLHRKGEPFRTRIVSMDAMQPYPFNDLMRRLNLNLSVQTPKPATVLIDAATGEIGAKVTHPGRHEYLVRWAAQLNWRGIPPEAVMVAVHAENLRICEPPKTQAEVQAIVADILMRYASQHGRDQQSGGAAPAEAAPLDPLAALCKWIVTDEQVLTMKQTRLIWRDLIALSHLAVWSAPGNGGKTSIAKFAAGELARDEFTVLFFQEDASAGDLPALHEHAKQQGYRLLNSTLAGSAPEDQIKVLRTLTQEEADLANFVMFFDTLKKYADLMNKGGSRVFFQIMRALTQRGATVILLGHTNKHKGVDGKLIFEGVGDVRNDVDELLYIEATEKDAAGIVTMTIKPDKVRCAIKEATFTLDTKTMIVSALDRVVDVAAIAEVQRQTREDAQMIGYIRHALSNGGMNRTDLIAHVADVGQCSRNSVREVVDRYCAEDLSDAAALWLETRLRMNNTRHISLRPAC